MSSPFIQKQDPSGILIDDFNHIMGDLSLTLYWTLKQDLTSNDITSMYVLYSDSDTSSSNSIDWKQHIVLRENYASSTTITFDDAFIGKKVIYNIFAIYIQPGGQRQVYQPHYVFETSDVVITAPTRTLVINQYDGRSTLANEENVYYLNISNYLDIYGDVYFNIAIRADDGKASFVTIPPSRPLEPNSPSLYQFNLPTPPSESRFFRLEGIILDLIHEVSVFYESKFASALSNTVRIINTKQLLLSTDLTNGKSPRFIINDLSAGFNGNKDGKIKFMTNFNNKIIDNTIERRNPESSLKLLLFLIEENLGNYPIPTGDPPAFKELNLLDILYDENTSFDGSLNEYTIKSNFENLVAEIDIEGAETMLNDPNNLEYNKLQYNKRYKLIGATQTDQVRRTDLLMSYSTPDFCIQKTPLKPTINNCYLLQEDASGVKLFVDWTDGEMFLNDVDSYSLKITYLDQLTERLLEVIAPDIYLQSSHAVYNNTNNFVPGREYYVSVRTHVTDLNNSLALLDSDWSTPVTFTYYRIPDFSPPNLSVRKNIDYVNEKAILDWKDANTSRLSIEKVIVFYKEKNATLFNSYPQLPGNTDMYESEDLTNGTTYNYKVELTLTAKEYKNNNQVIIRESIESSVITFTPWTLPEKPIINDCYLSQYNDYGSKNTVPPLNVSWTNGTMYNSMVDSYSLRITYLNESNEIDLEDLEYEILSIQDSSGGVPPNSSAVYINTNNFFTGREYKFYVQTNVLDLNNAVDQSNNTLVLSSQLSTPVTFTYYRVSDFTSLNLSVDKNIESVNSKALLSWNKPLTSNLPILRYELYRSNNSENIPLYKTLENEMISHEDSLLVNGLRYYYSIKAITQIKEYRSSIQRTDINEVIESLIPANIIPWQLPLAPSLNESNSSYSIGNRYVDLRISAVDNYTQYYINGYNVRYKLNSSQDYATNQFNVSTYNYNVRIGNIENEKLYDFNANVIYKDPNDNGVLHPTLYSSPDLQRTPTAIKDDYAVTNLVFSEIGDEKVKVTWTKPVLVDFNPSNFPNIVGDNRKFKRYEINVYEKTENGLLEVYTLNSNGSVIFQNGSVPNTLTYTFNKNFKNGIEKVLVNGKTYKFSVSACYESETSTQTETVKNVTSSNADIFPYMTYSVTDLMYTSKDYDTGNIDIAFTYSTSNNNNANYLNKAEIWVNDVNRYPRTDVSVDGYTSQTLTRNDFLPSVGVVDERQQKVVVRLIFNNPNNAINGEEITTWADSSPFLVRSYKRPDNLSLEGTNVTDSSVLLYWDFPSTSFKYDNLYYNLAYQKTTDLSYALTSDIPKYGTSFNLAGLVNEKTYRIKIKSAFNDQDNNDPPIDTLYPDIVTIRTHLPSPTDLTFKETIATDHTIMLKIDTPSTIVGLDVLNYKLYYRPVIEGETFPFDEILLLDNAFGGSVDYTVQGLDNGTVYEVYYTADLNNTENTEEGQESPLIARSELKLLTPLKKAEAVDDLRVVSHNSGESINLSWTKPELNGSSLVGYRLYQKRLLDSSSNWTFLQETTSVNYTFTAPDSSYYDNIYEFHVIVVSKDVNTKEKLYSIESNPVDHHFFEAPKDVMIYSHSFISTNEEGNITYSIKFKIQNYYLSKGLSQQLLEVKLNDSLTSSTHIPIPVTDLNLHEFTLTGINEKITNSINIRVIGKNPNNLSLLEVSEYSDKHFFNYYTNPVLQNSGLVVESNDSSFIIKINDSNDSLNLMNTIFQHYEVNISILQNENYILKYSNILTDNKSVNNLIVNGLINGETYRVSVRVIGISPVALSSENLASDVIYKDKSPIPFIQSGDIPYITLKSEINNRLTFNVDTKGEPLLGWYLFIQYDNIDHPQYPRYNQFLYRSPPNSISSENENNIIEIVIDVLKELNSQDQENLSLNNIQYSFVAYNINGRDEYNHPEVIYDPSTTTGNYIMYTNAGNLSNGYLQN